MVCILIEQEGQGQHRLDGLLPYSFQQPIFPSSTKTIIPHLLADPTRNHRVGSPLMTNLSTWNWPMQNSFFWTATVTTMSYNKGKFGTFFYWDIQGNLQGESGFIDISGKNKRGLKLVFPWRQFARKF